MANPTQEASMRDYDRTEPPADDVILSFKRWCELNNFSEATGIRLRRAGRGPTFVRISDRRIGVTVRENRRWQNSRALIETENPAA
jgi:hypothetical protein